MKNNKMKTRQFTLGSSGLAIMLIAALSLLSARATELISNGGFESGSTSWTANTLPGGASGSVGILQGAYPHAGSWYAYLGDATSTSANALGSVYQFITIPANATTITLSFYINIVTAETTVGPYDVMSVGLRTSSDVPIQTLRTFSEADKGANTPGSYSLVTIDMTSALAAYKGQTVILQFYVDTDPSKATIFRIDDVSVTATTSCNYSLSPTSANPGSGASSGSFTVTVGTGCTWSAVSDSTSWLHTSSSGTGSGTVSYSYDANTGSSRTGHITVGGQTFTVTQGSGSCSYSLSSYSASPSSSSGSSSFTITTGSGCIWSAVSDSTSWLTTSSSGTGNGTVSYSYTANTGSSRTGHITEGGQTFTVTQTGSSSTTLLGSDFNADGGSINWAQEISSSPNFMIIKATQGDNPNSFLPSNMSGAPAVTSSFSFGLYDYADPDEYANPSSKVTNPSNSSQVIADAQAAANSYYQIAKPYLTAGHLQPALDLEDDLNEAGTGLWEGGFNLRLFRNVPAVFH